MPPAPAPDLGLAGERRQLTVFFCDLVGSMELAARLDPEDWPDVLWTYRTRAGEVVARHGGHVAQYFGDGILIYFGWPNTYDDTAELTARAALGLVEVAATGRADGTVLSVRVGLHTGPVVVRALGHSRREAREDRTRAASLSPRRRRGRCSRTFSVSRRPRCSRLAPTSSGGRRSISWRNGPSPERGTVAGPPGRGPALVRPVVTGALGRLIAQSPTARARQRHGATGVHAAVVGALQLDYAAARLTQRQARDMFATLGGRELSADTLDALIARADGVPLYLEERTKAVARGVARRGGDPGNPGRLADGASSIACRRRRR